MESIDKGTEDFFFLFPYQPIVGKDWKDCLYDFSEICDATGDIYFPAMAMSLNMQKTLVSVILENCQKGLSMEALHISPFSHRNLLNILQFYSWKWRLYLRCKLSFGS